jgi:L-ribulokinase
MTRYALGLDFGTESVRAMVVDVAGGAPVATAEHAYSHGVIDRRLPDGVVSLPPDFALQSSDDWLASAEHVTRAALADAAARPADVVGIGIDFTACTVLPALADGTPLHTLEAYRDRPHAWPKLWKHHAAQPQADRLNALAVERGEAWLARYGGKVSSEWLIPKALQVLEEAPDVYAAADVIVEGADWFVWQLTGNLARNACAAGYKATWHKATGYPAGSFLADLHPGLADLYETRIRGQVIAPGTGVGGLTPAWAQRLGLAPGTPVGAGIIDAHAATLGAGVGAPGTLFIMMGTSSCHMLLATEEVLVPGQSGVVEDGIVPGLFAYEAGQAGVGDMFAWFVRSGVPPALHEEAAATGRSLHDVLSARAAKLRPGASGLLALDWWNGCRTPLVDADLSGAVLGYTLQTSPEEVYRALVESTAFGTRLIVETLANAGLPIGSIRVAGGLTRNEMLMRVYADVTGLPIEVSSTLQASAIGAAILGAVAGGAHRDVSSAVDAMGQSTGRTVQPDAANHVIYDALYAEYGRLVDLFGRDGGSTLKRLRAIRAAAAAAA